MKKPWFLFSFFIGIAMLCSCTQTLYTHQQVLQRCKTKDDVLKRFGKPDEVNPGPGFDQWTYNMENRTDWKKPKRDQPQIAVPDSLVKDSLQEVRPDKYAKYVKFMFDGQGNITGYKADGIDLTHKEKDSFGKSFVNITGGILILSALVALELYKDGAFDN